MLAEGDAILEGLFADFVAVVSINVAFGDGGFKEGGF